MFYVVRKYFFLKILTISDDHKEFKYENLFVIVYVVFDLFIEICFSGLRERSE